MFLLFATVNVINREHVVLYYNDEPLLNIKIDDKTQIDVQDRYGLYAGHLNSLSQDEMNQIVALNETGKTYLLTVKYKPGSQQKIQQSKGYIIAESNKTTHEIVESSNN